MRILFSFLQLFSSTLCAIFHTAQLPSSSGPLRRHLGRLPHIKELNQVRMGLFRLQQVCNIDRSLK